MFGQNSLDKLINFVTHADCCDGSDEVSGCANTCVQEGAAARKALQASVAESVAGLKVRVKVVQRFTDF